MQKRTLEEPGVDSRTALERLTLPFTVKDDLVEPFPTFMVIRILFDQPVESQTMGTLDQAMHRWLAYNGSVAKGLGKEEPVGEALQLGELTVEFQIQGAQGNPDDSLSFLLEDLARLSRTVQQIVGVELD